MNATRTGAILMAAVLLVSAVAPAVTGQTEESLSLDVTQDETGAVTITVADDGTAVENATVNVTANDTYADAGEFETDTNGTVTLANPENPVELTITATDENDTATTTVAVQPVQTLAVGVDQADDGTVTVVATASSTATTTAELESPESVGPFGQVVSAFVDALRGAGFTGIGSQVSDLVTSNNPSNAVNSDAVSPPEAGNNAPVTPPGQEKKNESRVVPATPPVDSPGNSGSPPGQSDGDDESDEDAPGNSGSAPGQSDEENESGEDEDDESDEENESDEGEDEESDEDDGSDEEDEADSDDSNGNGNGR